MTNEEKKRAIRRAGIVCSLAALGVLWYGQDRLECPVCTTTMAAYIAEIGWIHKASILAVIAQ